MELDAKAAQAVLLAIAGNNASYNEGWAWWAHDVAINEGFEHGNVRVTKIQESLGDYDTAGYNTQETEMVWKFESGGGQFTDEKFFQLRGEYTSYDGDDWNNTVREVRPTEKVVRVFEYVR